MSIILCPECEADISSNSRSCPKCGYAFKKSPRTQSSSNTNKWIIIFTALLCLVIGFFAGREYFRWEIKQTLKKGIEGFMKGFGYDSKDNPLQSGKETINNALSQWEESEKKQEEEEKAHKIEADNYIKNYLEFSDLKADDDRDLGYGAGVSLRGKVKNIGTKEVDRIHYTIYYFNSSMDIINEYSGECFVTLKGGYEDDLYNSLSNIPDNWGGHVEVQITNIEFSN